MSARSAWLILTLAWLAPGVAVTMDAPAPLTLREALRLGLARNPELETMRRQLEVAAGKLRTALTRPYNPELDAGITTDKGLSDEGQKELELGISQQLETGGKRRHRVGTARLELEQARLGAEDRARILSSEIALAFYRTYFLQRRLSLNEEAVGIARSVERIAKGRAELGDLPSVEVSLAEVSREKRAAEAVGLEADLASARVTLESLLGLPETTASSVTADWSPAAQAPPEQELLDAATRSRPDLRQRELAVRVAEEQLALQKAGRHPDVKAGLFYSRGTDVIDAQASLPPLTDRDELVTLRLNVGLPIVNRNQGEILAAKASVGVARSQLESLRLEVRRQVRDARERGLRAAQRCRLYSERVVPVSARNVEVAERAYRTGLADTLQILKAQDDLIDVRQRLLEALWDHEQARIALDTATGHPPAP